MAEDIGMTATNLNALAQGQCPSCKVHPHRQACCLMCEDARIEHAFTAGQVVGIERSAEEAQQSAIYYASVPADRRPGDPRYQHQATAALDIKRKIDALSPDPDYIARVKAGVWEEAAHLAFDKVQTIEESENQYSTLQKAACVAAALRSQTTKQ